MTRGKKRILHGAAVVVVLLEIAACATQRPVLSANDHLMRVGAEVGERDIDACMEQPEATAKERQQPGKEGVVAGAATGSVVGAAAGGAGGAISGHAGQGAAAGAVGGTVASLTRALLDWLFRRKPPDPSNREFVENCLRQKGYEPAGWN